MAYEARLEIGVDSRDAKRDVDGLDDSLGRVEKSGNRADKATRRFGKGARSTANDLNKLRTVAIGFVGAIGGAAALRAITRSADTYTNLRSQLRLVTESQEELNEVYQQTFQLAQTTRQDLEGTVGLYARLARSTDELGLSNSDLLTITRAVNQSFVISGASAQEAAGAVRQLSQGMASGTLRGEELNSVMENSPRLARAIAEEMGKSIGELRQMGADGKITAEAISTALIGAADDIDREFRTMERTVGQAMQQLRNDVLNALGPTETAPLVDAIDDLRDLVSDPAFRENLISLTSAAIGGFKSLSEVIANTGKELRMLGVIEGPEADSFAQLKEVQRQIKELEAEAGKSLLQRDLLLSPMGPGLWSEGEIKDRIRQLKAEAAVIRENLIVQPPSAGGESSGSSGGSFTPRQSGPTEDELKAQEEALQRVIDAASARTAAFREAAEADKEVEQARMDALEDVRASLRSEEEAINASYQRRMQMVLENTVAGSDQRTQLEMKLAQDRVNQLNAIEDQRLEHQQQLGQELLTFTSQQLSITTNMLATAGKKNSDLYKTLIAIQRAAAIPSMIIATEDAATKALAWGGGGPAGIALSNTVRALGYASVGIAGAQVFQGSFDGGGFTGVGPRSGGIDGKGGFPAIMHPNETVVDHAKGQKLGGDVIVNVNNAPAGTTVQRRQMDGREVVDVMVADINDDGPVFRALQSRSNVRRVGT
ncbi:MAG: tape measure protein [Alcanivorax jadensis]|uniref:tape measure protein n=1 Tax=Alcanivorax jadensis TaxID=64988 RepID=UPI0030035978